MSDQLPAFDQMEAESAPGQEAAKPQQNQEKIPPFDEMQSTEEFETPGGIAHAALSRAASQATLGGSKLAERALDDPEKMRAREAYFKEVHPVLHLGADIAGLIAGPGGLFGKAGKSVGGMAAGLGAGVAGELAAKYGVETGLMAGSDEAEKFFSSDPEQSFGSAVKNVGLSAAMGAAGGAAWGLGAKGLSEVKNTALGTAVGKIKDNVVNGGMEGLAKKTISTLSGVPVEKIDAYLADRDAINRTPEFRVIYDDLLNKVEAIHNRVAKNEISEKEAKTALNDASRFYRDQITARGASLSQAASDANKALKVAQGEAKERVAARALDAAPEVVAAVEALRQKVVGGSQGAYQVLENYGKPVSLSGFYEKADKIINNLRTDKATPESQAMADRLEQYIKNVSNKGAGISEKVGSPEEFFGTSATKIPGSVSPGGPKPKGEVSESLSNYSTPRLKQLIQDNGFNPEAGTEINVDAAHEELMRRAENKSEGMTKDWLKSLAANEERTAEISPVRAKSFIQDLDENSKYNFAAQPFDKGMSRYYKQLRYELDSALKEAIPEYKKAMVPVAQDAELLNQVSKFGDETAALRRINSLKSSVGARQYLPSLRKLEESTGLKFMKPLEDHALYGTGDSILKTLPEYEAQTKAAEAVGAFNSPETKQLLRKSIETLPEFAAHAEAQERLADAVSAKDALSGITPTNLETKLKAAMRGRFNVEKGIEALGKYGNKPLSEVLENLAVKQAFEGGSTNGSRKAVLFGGLGGLLGGHTLAGIGLGNLAGAYMDTNGHEVVKKLLDWHLDRAAGDIGTTVGGSRSALRHALSKAIDTTKDITGNGFRATAHMITQSMTGFKDTKENAKAVVNGKPVSVNVPKKDTLEALDARLKELASNPKEIAKVGQHLSELSPDHGQMLSKTVGSAVSFLNSMRPVHPKMSPLDGEIPISKAEKAEYMQTLSIAENPEQIILKIKDGSLLPKDMTVIQAIHPGYAKTLTLELSKALSERAQSGDLIPYKTRQSLALALGMQLDSTMSASSIQAAQATFLTKQAQQPRGGEEPQKGKKGSTSKLGKLASNMQTPEQSRAERQTKG